ncbi:14863_t:CDS:2, partial [Dentiscutata heterogama]
MSGESIYIHEYFDSKSADWNITRFLKECTEKSYQLKIGLYLKSLENIMNNEQGNRKQKAQLLYDKYKKDTRPDHQIAKNWEAERRANKTSSGPSINIHNSTFSGSDQRIGTINDESFN